MILGRRVSPASGTGITSVTNDRKPRALVTGGAGFLGSHLCERLLSEGYRVLCMDNLITGSYETVAHLGESEPDFEYIDHDVSTHIDVPGELKEVYHFASPASPKDFARIPIPILKVGALGTYNSLGLARLKGARFMLASNAERTGDQRRQGRASVGDRPLR